MSHPMALVFLLMISPAAGLAGMILLLEPHEVVRLAGRVADWNRKAFGIGPEARGLGWMHTPVHRLLLGDRETLVQRMCQEPEGFRVINGFLRVNGVLLISVSLAAALGSAVALAT